MDKERGVVFTRGTLDQMNRQLNFTDSPELEQLAWIAEYTSSVRLYACVFVFSAWLHLFSHFREYISV